MIVEDSSTTIHRLGASSIDFAPQLCRAMLTAMAKPDSYPLALRAMLKILYFCGIGQPAMQHCRTIRQRSRSRSRMAYIPPPTSHQPPFSGAIPISYTLRDPENNPVSSIRAFLFTQRWRRLAPGRFQQLALSPLPWRPPLSARLMCSLGTSAPADSSGNPTMW